MIVRARSCGLEIEVETDSPSWARVVDRALGGPMSRTPDERYDGSLGGAVAPDIRVRVESSTDAFSLPGLRPVTRGACGDGSRVILVDACGSGLDLLVDPSSSGLTVTVRARPAVRHRALHLVDPARTELLWRAALLQYPALWWAGARHGAVPLHVSAARIGASGVVLAGPGGVGKSTLLHGLAPDDGIPVSDNLCTYESGLVHGLAEPVRVEAGVGRHQHHLRPRLQRVTMPHGRVEQPWVVREPALWPSLLLVLSRGSEARTTVRPVSAEIAARTLTAGTYAAGELRRYWAFAATLALGTGLGPAHPAVDDRARRLTRQVRCAEVVLASRPDASLARIVDLAEGWGLTQRSPQREGSP
ncbi:MAG: hypothetical protein M3Y71_03365 [Actinomycetota bacterium]|nr:hypothetical protein [Actinomycetota bacterium]